MDVDAKEIARRVADRLAVQVDPRLPLLVEAELAQSGKGDQFSATLALSVASLVVSVARFAWTLHQDLLRERRRLQAEAFASEHRQTLLAVLRQRLLQEVKVPNELESSREIVINAVVEELSRPTGRATESH